LPAFCRFLAKQQALAFTRACLIGFANGFIANNSVLPTKHSTSILSSSSKFFCVNTGQNSKKRHKSERNSLFPIERFAFMHYNNPSTKKCILAK